MIRCVRLFTGPDEQSHVQIGRIDLVPGRNNDLVSAAMASTRVTAEETATGGALAWHTAPVRQLVVTLTGTLSFTTRDGEQFTLAPATCCWPRTPPVRVTNGTWSATPRGDGSTSFSPRAPTSRSSRTSAHQTPRRVLLHPATFSCTPQRL